MNIKLLILNSLNMFSNSEKIVANFVMENLIEIPNMSTNELAEKANVSVATVNRFSKKLYPTGGFPQLKLEIAMDSSSNGNSILNEFEPEDNLSEIKEKLASRFSYTIQRTKKLVEEDNIQAVIDCMKQEKIIFTFGSGSSELVANDIRQKFSRIGRNIVQIHDPHQLVVGMSTHKKSILIAISNSGETKTALDMASVAKEFDFEIIALTSNKNSTLAKKSDYVLQSDSTGEGALLRSSATTSLISQLFLVDCLYYAAIKNNFKESVELIKTTKEITDGLYNQKKK
ncbi:transcriptional regulator [Companilactobacillus sp. RD055328]|uniref:MurR/RpiR family transcriptional regulator n=1 Tax=Companilactobacillus sp. RD055328 TaxID=2916634 RepID=UPI001FC86FF5|nr:MurR/RpiR family transcriptional regulator [Companilactobacillus sp. RD055328]GKQ43451.1 transcriptional regulator [Companilactobacillus sp. RD055328]